jgi:hypothetical protein
MMPKRKNRNMKRIILMAILLVGIMQVWAQTPGLIIKPALAPGNSVLDPDGDGYVSQKTNGVQLGFTTPDPNNDVYQSEIPYVAIIRPDPLDDILRGPVGGFIEIVGVDEAGNNAILTYRDNNYIYFRFRMGGYAPNSKSYSLLIDTDQKFGLTGPNADPNAMTGNLGFEVEIVLNTNFTVQAYNCDGKADNATLVKEYSYDTNCQKAMCVTNGGGDPDYFYDFYLVLSDISSVITASTPLRIVALTTMNPHPAIGNNALSDIGGVTTGNNIDQIFEELIDGQTPTIPGEEVKDRTECPTINAVNTSATSISGTLNGTGLNYPVEVKVYKNNTSTLLGTVSVSSGTNWELTGVSGLADGNTILATAQETGEGVSYSNCSIQTVTSCSTLTTAPTGTEVVKISGSKGFDIVLTSTRPVGTKVYLYTSNYTLRGVSDLKNAVTNPFNTTTSPQTFSYECQTGNCFGTDVYYVRFEEPGKCISPFYVACDYATGTSAAPTITTTSVTTSTTTISGTGTTASSQIFLYADGTPIGNTTAGALSPFNWSISVSGLTLCQVITAKQIVAGACLSAVSNSITVSRAATKPTILTSGCGIPSPVAGTSSENGATVTLYRVGTPDVSLGSATVSSGEWSITPSPALANGNVIYAKITSGTCLTASANSDQVTIKTQTATTNLAITTYPIYENATSATLTGTGNNNGDIITLYVGGSPVYDGSGNILTATVSGGAWSMSLPANELYIGASVYVTATASGQCESSASASKTVQCVTPTTPSYTGGSKTYCIGGAGSVSLLASQPLVMYQLVDGSGTAVGPASAGTGSGITLTTYALNSDLLNVYVKAYKIGYSSCSVTATTEIDFDTESPTPSITLDDTSLDVPKGTTTVNLPYSAKSTTPVAEKYAIDFPLAANNQGFIDVTTPQLLNAAPSNIAITVPANPALGTYSGTLRIDQSGGTGCSRYYSFTITVYDGAGAPSFTTQPSNYTICSGGNATLSVVTLPSSGVTFQWQIATAYSGPFSNISSATSDSYNTGALAATRYYRVLATNSGNTSVSNVATVMVIGTNTVGLASSTPTLCINTALTPITHATTGATGIGAATGLPSGVTASWNANVITISGTPSSSGTFSYTIPLTGGCGSESATGTITVNPIPVINNKTKDACSGAAFTILSGDLSGTVPVGTTFSWSAPTLTGGVTGGASGSGVTSITGTLTNPTTTVQTATYTVTPTANGCAGSVFTVTVSVSAPITATATGTNPLCYGGLNGSISLTVSGGSPSYAYSWTSVPSGFTATTQNISSLSVKQYDVSVTDSKGCTKTATATLTNPAEIAINPAVTDVACRGGSNGSIALAPTNGTEPYTYLWENGAASATRSGLAAGTYSVTVTDANGCTKSGNIVVGQPAADLDVSGVLTHLVCNGGTTGAINITATGGNTSYTYLWNGGSTDEDRTGLPAGSYSVTVTDNKGCTKFASYTLTQPTVISATITTLNHPTCPSDSDGSINLTVSGGTPGVSPNEYTYLWTTTNGAVSDTEKVKQDPSGLESGTYSVKVTDSAGCFVNTSGILTYDNPNPVTPGAITK